jgi:hypothetical protein
MRRSAGPCGHRAFVPHKEGKIFVSLAITSGIRTQRRLELRLELPKPQRVPFGQATKGQAKHAACLRHLRNTQQGGLCEQSSQPSSVQTRQFSLSWHPCAGVGLSCSSLFSNRKREREEVTRENRASISLKHRVALPAMARGQRSTVNQTHSAQNEKAVGGRGRMGWRETGVGGGAALAWVCEQASQLTADCFLLATQGPGLCRG